MVHSSVLSSPRNSAPIHTEGGKVQASGGVYITRTADQDLFDNCMRGHISYILHTRQVGKSSLIGNVAQLLRDEGVRVVMVDLTMFGVGASAEQWYLGLLQEIAEQLDLETDVFEWWDENGRLSMALRVRRFFSDVVVGEIQGPVVVFLDEIDTTIPLDFTDDFFAAIRELYHARVTERDLKRLTFVIVGSASPNDLMKDASRTPFNIGERVELTDFTLDEAMPLTEGFAADPVAARSLLSQVLNWTGGHPYLTQVVCKAIARSPRPVGTFDQVDEIVRERFLTTAGDQERNLRFVSDMLTARADRIGRRRVLHLYRKILRSSTVPDEGQSAVMSHLKLAGVVKIHEGRVVPRNELYRRIFDEAWVKKHMPFSWKEASVYAFEKSVPALIVLGIVGPVAVLASKETAEYFVAKNTVVNQIKVGKLELESTNEALERGRRESTQMALKLDRERKLLAELAREKAAAGPAALQVAEKNLELRGELARMASRLKNGLFPDPTPPRGGWPRTETPWQQAARVRKEALLDAASQLEKLSKSGAVDDGG